MAGTTSIKANAAGSTGDLSKWNEDPGDAIDTSSFGAPPDARFQLVGNQASRFTPGTTFSVVDSTATPSNDGEYTVRDVTWDNPNTSIYTVESVAGESEEGKLKKHRVPIAADVVDINGKRVVQAGLPAVAEIKDVPQGGKFVVTGPFTPTLVTDIVVFDALPPGSPLMCG